MLKVLEDPVLNMPILTQFPHIASLAAVNSIANTVYVTNTGSDTLLHAQLTPLMVTSSALGWSG